jgi:peroxiredoxin Q/BCP
VNSRGSVLYNRELLFKQAADHYNMTPALNKPLPEFEAIATGGVKFTPQSFVGQTVVLYFYPKDHTPGCTTEAMQFRDKHKEFVKAGAVVFGVSRDNLASHDKFKQNLELPFELIADTEEKLCHMFGVVKNKIMYGKKVKGIERSTFLISPDGILREEWRGLKVAGHVEEVLLAVQGLKQEAA